eukprot:7209776-Prymnesium_polylepis.1
MHPGRLRIRGSSLKTALGGGHAAVERLSGPTLDVGQRIRGEWSPGPLSAAGVAGTNGRVCLPVPLKWYMGQRQGHGTKGCVHTSSASPGKNLVCADRAGQVKGGRIVSKPRGKSYVLIVRGRGQVQVGAEVTQGEVQPNLMVAFCSGWMLLNCTQLHMAVRSEQRAASGWGREWLACSWPGAVTKRFGLQTDAPALPHPVAALGLDHPT